MRGKSVVGWLCVFSLVGSIILAAYAVYVFTVPFLNGGAIYMFQGRRWPTGLTERIAKAGLGAPAQDLLTDWVRNDQKSRYTRSGWDAAMWMLTERPPVVTTMPSTTVAALVVLDDSNKPVAQYPYDLFVDGPPPFVPGGQGEWERELRRRTEEWGPPAGQSDYYPINSPAGKRLGTLAILWRDSNEFAYMPAGFRDWNFGAASNALWLSLGLIVLSLLLIPVWVGMDAAWRGMRPVAWGLLVFVTSVIGLLAYLIARLSPPRPCPNCGEPVLSKYRRCPQCGLSLLSRCPTCGARMRPGWQYCPACTRVPAQVEELRTAAPPPPAPPPVTEGPAFTISAIDAESGAPVAGARVSVTGPSTLAGATNNEGVFQARRLMAGDYVLTVAKQGYESANAPVTFEERLGGSATVALRALPASVSGRVVDRASASPVVGANVCLDTARVDVSAVTDLSGAYSLGDVPAGPYVVRAEAEGFEPRTRLVELAPGQRAAVDLVLDPAPAVVGAEQEQDHGRE